jgi:spermidine/putrescine transport system substrate-binding protein
MSRAAAYSSLPVSSEGVIVRKSEFTDRLADARWSRRKLGRLLATAGLAAVALPVGGRCVRAADQAIYLTWKVYGDPGFFPDYVAKHGANPEMTTLSGDDKDVQRLQKELVVDVAHPCNSGLARWYQAGVLQPIDTTRLAHWPDLFEPLTTLKDAQQNGQQYFVPVDWGATSVIYRSDIIKPSEQSWNLLWDERYKGKLSVSRSAEETCAIAAILTGAKDPFNMTDDEIAAVKDLLLKQKPLLRYYWDRSSTVEKGLAEGQLVAATGWNSSIADLRKKGVRVKVMEPKEGILIYCCGLVLTRNAPHLDAAYDLIDAITAPEAGKWLIEQLGFGHANRRTFDLVDEQILADHGLPKDPKDLLSTAVLLQKNSRIDALNWMFETVRAGL